MFSTVVLGAAFIFIVLMYVPPLSDNRESGSVIFNFFGKQ